MIGTSFSPPMTRIAWATAALVASLCFSLPLAFLLLAGGSYLPFANESIAYRYFTSVRILDGQGGAVWTAQGQLATLVQNAIVTVLQSVKADLKTSVESFGIFTSAVAGLSMFVVNLCAALDRKLLPADRMLVMVLGPATIFGTINAGFYYSLLPDYYVFSLVIISASLYLALRFHRSDITYNARDLYSAGVLCGIAAANKLTLLGPAGIVALIAIARLPLDRRLFLNRTLLIGVVCIATFGVVFLGVYDFHPRDALSGFAHTVGFLKSAGAEPGFWEGNFWMFQKLYNYDKIFFVWMAATLYLSIEILRQKAWRAALILGANLLVASLLAIGLYKRGAGTTFFEISSILAGLAALSLAVGLGLRKRALWAKGLPAMIFIAALSQFDFGHNWFVVSKSRELARTSWEVHDYAMGLGRPLVVVIPDESYVSNGVEDLFNKGLRDLSSGKFDSAKGLKERIAPHTDFRLEPGTIQTGTAVLWIEKWDVLGGMPLKESNLEEAKRWQTLSRIAPLNRCRAWRTGYSNQLLVHVCTIDRVQ